MCNAPMRSHGDDTQQVVSNSDWTSRMRPMQNTSPWIRSSDHPIYARTRIWRACRSKPQAAFAGAYPDNRLASQRRVVLSVP